MEIDLGVQSSVFHTPEGSPDVCVCVGGGGGGGGGGGRDRIALQLLRLYLTRATARAKIGRGCTADCADSEEP